MDLRLERQRFERFCLDNNIEHSSVKNEDGSVLIYYNAITNHMWNAWVAALTL